ncbi:hypothetical protein KUCAC02_034759 [Chaenocephalus aceratus]|nr:hypothetical protein KUCAC02_034759 [Chaenocephalus aceratus]
MERDQKGKVQLYCSSPCVELSRPPQHILTGAAFPCCECNVSAVPQYHLAMVDGTIRNFCSYDCVSIYRKSGNTSQPDLTNGTPALRDPKAGPSAGQLSPSTPSGPPVFGSLPGPPSQSYLSAPARASLPGPRQNACCSAYETSRRGPRVISKLTCHQCSKEFSTKPLLFSHQVRSPDHIL